jgi:hypothetical protein
VKLHRLVLTNYRGITHREIEFPDHGVVVVSGANEIGKSSMIEALDLLLESKDRSTRKEVKQVKPTHADVGAEVTAEISTGPYRFIYGKRFHKKAQTQLTVLAPRREQLTGDEAHDRVLALLAETLDTELWQAQRILQAASTAAVDLSGCDALSRALDAAAGDAVQCSGAEPLLIDRIELEYSRYFTPTGRPTGEWATVINRLSAADAEVARCAAAVAEVDDGLRRHTALNEQRRQLVSRRETAARQLAAAQAAADAVAALTDQLRQAEVVAAAAEATRAASSAALTERRRLRSDVDCRGEVIAGLETAATGAAAEEGAYREVCTAAELAAGQSRSQLESARVRVESARRADRALSDRDEAAVVASRLARVDSVRRDLDRVGSELGGIVLSDVMVRDIERAAAAVEGAAGLVELASARIELTATADIELRVDGQMVALTAGTDWSASATSTTDIELPGGLVARIIPGLCASDNQAKLDAARRDLDAALTAARVLDVAAARAVDQRRRELLAARDRLTATLAGLCGDETVDELRSRLTALREREAAGAGLCAQTLDAAGARAELEAAEVVHRQAVENCETQRKVAVAAAVQLAERTTRASVLAEKLTAAQVELTAVRERLIEQRAAATDDGIGVRAQADADAARAAAGAVTELGRELAGTAPGAVAASLADATENARAVGRAHDEVDHALREVTAQLKVYGTQGRKGLLDAAESEREHAEGEHTQLHRRARAAQLLRSVMARHRDATRLRYVEPFRNEVERLGRLVFGASFEVEIDSDLRICSRTLTGRTVPYESLSGGAKEQLGIVARLAGAALVAKEDTVPVVIDDALGFTDADRLAKMGAVFDAVGGDGQVIVLTCSPERYDGVRGAHRIELSS